MMPPISTEKWMLRSSPLKAATPAPPATDCMFGALINALNSVSGAEALAAPANTATAAATLSISRLTAPPHVDTMGAGNRGDRFARLLEEIDGRRGVKVAERSTVRSKKEQHGMKRRESSVQQLLTSYFSLLSV